MGPLKFKPYVPKPHRSRKPKPVASAPTQDHEDPSLLEPHDEDGYLQSGLDVLSDINVEEIQMITSLPSFEWLDEERLTSVTEDQSPYPPVNGIETRGPSGDSPRPASQPTYPDETFETTPEHGKTKGAAALGQADVREADPSKMHGTVEDQPQPTTLQGPGDEEIGADITIQAAPTHSQAAATMPTPTQTRDSLRCSLSPPAVRHAATAELEVDSLSENLPIASPDFERWLEGNTSERVSSNPKQAKRAWGYQQDGTDSVEGRPAKGQRSSNMECVTLPRQLRATSIASMLPDDTAAASGDACQSVRPSHVKGSQRGGIRSSRQPNPTLLSGTTQYESPVSLSASICSAPNSYTPATSGHIPRPLRAELTQSILLHEAEEIGPAGECESCAILHAALIRALLSLQRQPSKRVSTSVQHSSPAGLRKPRYALRRRRTLPGSQYGDCLAIDAPIAVDDHSGQSDVDIESSTNDDDEILADESPRRRRAGKRRRWTQTEECRLKAWKLENQPETWIARRLGRSVSAIKQQWSKMRGDE